MSHIVICAGWEDDTGAKHPCGRLLAQVCPQGHEHPFPKEGVDVEIARMLAEVGLTCPACKLPINIDKVSHSVCPACRVKLEEPEEIPEKE
jgi:hypothetical protein